MTKQNTATTTPKPAAIPAAEPAKTMTVVKPDAKDEKDKPLSLDERIQRVENLQLLVTKRQKLLQTRGELEKFQISSNDFNCQLQVKDSDGNTFLTTFTPGIKKVIDFLKDSFDQSVKQVEEKIKF